ncbi:MAG: hypothetical protein GH155_01110 [Spirochaeta sp.]|nr:hypothetical protein [Spirochaeta sp.]
MVFHSLNKVHLNAILEMMICEVQERLLEQNISLEIRKEVKQYLVEKGYDEKFGARPLRRILQKEVEDPLSVQMLKGRFQQGSSIVVDFKEKNIVFRSKRTRKSLAKKEELVVG